MYEYEYSNRLSKLLSVGKIAMPYFGMTENTVLGKTKIKDIARSSEATKRVLTWLEKKIKEREQNNLRRKHEKYQYPGPEGDRE